MKGSGLMTETSEFKVWGLSVEVHPDNLDPKSLSKTQGGQGDSGAPDNLDLPLLKSAKKSRIACKKLQFTMLIFEIVLEQERVVTPCGQGGTPLLGTSPT